MSRLLLVALLLSCSAVSAMAGDDQFQLSPRHVAVVGTTVARVQPDIVVWHVHIRRAHKELSQAQKDCDAGVKKVLALRTELKLKPEDAQTGYLSVQKIYDRDQFGNVGAFRHFQVERSITLRQRDTSRFDEVLASLMTASDLEVSHSLESSEYHAVRAKTRLEAVQAARKKAEAMTDLLDAKLGRVLRIAEPQEQWGSSFIGNSNSAFVAPRNAEPDQAPGTFAPGAIEIKVSIEVAFEIE